MHQPAKGFAVDNAVTVALKGSAHWAGLFVFESAPGKPAFYGMG